MQPAFPTHTVASRDSPFCFHNPVSILQAFTRQSWRNLGAIITDLTASLWSKFYLLQKPHQIRSYSPHRRESSLVTLQTHIPKEPVVTTESDPGKNYSNQLRDIMSDKLLFCLFSVLPSPLSSWHQTAETAGLKINMCKSWFQLWGV